ncbi:MAG: hypothetical protein V3U24_01975 [Candidatus Neomarinimicrobiota bacterium]
MSWDSIPITGVAVFREHLTVNTEFFDVYERRPPDFHMLSPENMATYIAAIASGSLPTRLALMGVNSGRRFLNLLRRKVT